MKTDRWVQVLPSFATKNKVAILNYDGRNSGSSATKDRKVLAAAIKPIYAAASADAAAAELDAFEEGPWGKKFPTVVASWRRAWTHVIPFFAFPPKCAA